MCDSDNQQGLIADTSCTRRATLLTMTAAAVAAGIPATALAADVTEQDVMVPTPDGKADAALFHPAGAGPWPAVLMWPDILGLRPVFREMGRRLAAAGYVVLVPNPFYRTKPAPIVTGPFDFNDPKQMKPLMDLKATLTDAAGAYRLLNLPTGSYRIGFSDPSGWVLPWFYQSAPGPDGASAVSVEAERTLGGIDAALMLYGRVYLPLVLRS